MDYQQMFEIVKNLEFDTEKEICDDGETITYIYRPSKLPKRFQKYDLKKNFQIWICQGERNFKPNHLRIMIDLNLRSRCRPDLKKKMLQVFDNIFYKKDPDREIKIIEKEKFEHYLNTIKTIANLHQLFIIEQVYCYNKESKFDPPTLFYQGWVRQMIDSPKEIDNMCMSICNRQPPQAKYTNKENKKHKKFEENLKPLWYLES